MHATCLILRSLLVQFILIPVVPATDDSEEILRAPVNASAVPFTEHLGEQESTKYLSAFAFFRNKIPLNDTYNDNGSVHYRIGGVEEGLFEAYKVLLTIVGKAALHRHGLRYAMGPERSQGVNNARISRQRFLELALVKKSARITFPMIRSQAKNLDSFNKRTESYDLFSKYYDQKFFLSTSEPLNVKFRFSKTPQKDRKNYRGSSRKYLSSSRAWQLPAGDVACHPINPAYSRPGCVGHDNYARLSPLPMYLPSRSILNMSDIIELHLRNAAVSATGGKSAAFMALHLRLEKDWTKWFSKGICFNGTEVVRRAVEVARRTMCQSDDCPIVLFLMGNAYGDNKILWPKNVYHFSKLDFINAESITSDTMSALIDAELALRAELFVGTPRSGHSSIIMWDRHLLRKQSFIYERYVHICSNYLKIPMPEAVNCDAPQCSCLYGAFRTQCLNMHCITTGVCNFSFSIRQSKEISAKSMKKANLSEKREASKMVERNIFFEKLPKSDLHSKSRHSHLKKKTSNDGRVSKQVHRPGV